MRGAFRLRNTTRARRRTSSPLNVTDCPHLRTLHCSNMTAIEALRSVHGGQAYERCRATLAEYRCPTGRTAGAGAQYESPP